MKFEGFDWNKGNIEKCQKHGVTIVEIESVFADRVLILDDEENSETEQRFRAIGTTASGRMAFVVFTMRENFVRPISARYMHRKEITKYEKDNSEL